jgi:hypothetical protein
MVDVVKLAEAVASRISAPGDAEVMYAPELDLKGMKGLRIVVVPAGLVMKPLARGSTEDTLTVQVGVLRKCTEDDVPDLVNTVVTIGRSFLDAALEGATCTDVKYAPLYDAAHLRERRQFTGVVELTFKAVSRR